MQDGGGGLRFMKEFHKKTVFFEGWLPLSFDNKKSFVSCYEFHFFLSFCWEPQIVWNATKMVKGLEGKINNSQKLLTDTSTLTIIALSKISTLTIIAASKTPHTQYFVCVGGCSRVVLAKVSRPPTKCQQSSTIAASPIPPLSVDEVSYILGIRAMGYITV